MKSKTKKELAEIYRGAAEKALHGFGYAYLRDHGVNATGLYFPPEMTVSYDDRCLLLCLMAAMVEAGDASQGDA